MTQNVLEATVKLKEAPARLIVRLFGEAGAAAIAGVSVEAVKKWRRRRASGGGGGLIPSKYQNAYVRAAEVLDVDLPANAFIAEPY